MSLSCYSCWGAEPQGVNGSGSMNLKLALVIQVRVASSVNWGVGVAAGLYTTSHGTSSSCVHESVTAWAWKASCVSVKIWLFLGAHRGLGLREIGVQGYILPMPLTLCYLCTCLLISVPHVHADSPKRDQLHYYLNPNSVLGSDDDTNIPYFCTKKTALRKGRRMADGNCGLPGVGVYRDCLSRVFTHYLFIWYLLRKSQCSCGLSIICLWACTQVHNYL